MIQPHRRSERGAVLVHVAMGLASFTFISALVIDYGVQLVSRHQIQNAVDAAALASATALAYDSFTDRGDSGPAKSDAIAVARANLVWAEAPDVTAADVTFPVCPDSFDAGPSATPKLACVQVEAFRNVERNNALPTYFAQLFGSTASSVAARAMAQARDANATDCLKPLAVPDRWTERYPVSGTWDPASTFDKWDPANPNVLLAPPDSYTAPTPLSVGTGLRIGLDFGTQVVVSPGSTAIPISEISPWQYLAVQIPGSQFGPNDVLSNTSQCAKAEVKVGDRLDMVAGNVGGTIATGMQNLVDADPAATWNVANQRIQNSCADTWPRCASMSPRLIALPVYDLDDLADRSKAGATSVLVRNFVGFFIESVAGTSVTGRIARHPGLINTAAPILTDEATFLRASLLVK